MYKEVIKQSEERMKKAIENLKREFAGLKAGRATPALLDKVQVEYYGTPTPVNQLANITAPEPRLLVIQPWDKKAIKDIERAILQSDLNLTPTNDGVVIRISIPALTQERRLELVKLVKKRAEEERVAIRNIRRDANDHLKKMEKDHQITEDEHRKAQDEIQKLTDKYIKEVDQILANKEKEIMEV